MNFRLLLKVGAVFLVSLLLIIPISRVESLVQERQNLRDEVVADISRSAGYAQTIGGPFLVVPYERLNRRWTEETKERPRQLIEEVSSGELVFLPQAFNLSGKVDIEERSRGIYTARIFGLESELRGSFALDANYGITEGLADYTFGKPYLVLTLSDIRGITSGLTLRWNDVEVPFEPNTFPPGVGNGPALSTLMAAGVHASLPQPSTLGASWTQEFTIQLGVQGTGELKIVPVGRTSKVQLVSNWPHPSFVGDFLPQSHTISSSGFDASWESSFFSTNLEALAERCHAQPSDVACQEMAAKNFAVSFVDPVDHYLKSERATKYAFLFVGLTFAVFFLFEVLRRFSVHPVQYGLVGLALAVFFLLLLSLSEHLGFALAYALSACASVLLIGYYVAPILGSAAMTGGFGFTLASLYAVLYAILSSEDYALLTGSLVVFGVLGLAMVLTRRVNWTKFGQPSPLTPAGAPAPTSAPSAE